VYIVIIVIVIIIVMHVKTETTVEARRFPVLSIIKTSKGRRRQRLFLLGFLTLAILIQCLRLVRHHHSILLQDDTLRSSRVLLHSVDIPLLTITSTTSATSPSSATSTLTTPSTATTKDQHHNDRDNYTNINHMNDKNGSVDDMTEETFQWEYLNLAQNASCGQFKCYFRRINSNNDHHHPPFWNQSLTNLNNHNIKNDDNNDSSNSINNVHPTMAYLVEQVTSTKKEHLLWQATWNLAQTLHHNYSQPDYFLLGPPQTIALNEKWAARLNGANLYQNGNLLIQDPPPRRYRSTGMAVVQAVRPAPVPSILYGTSWHPEKYFWDHWEQELLIHVTDLPAFERTVLGQVESLLTFMTRNTQFKCLLRDFQVLIDTQGTFHPLDLNRCINRDGTIRELKTPEGRMALRRIKVFQKRIVKQLRTFQETSVRY
jgi:hypothetical protein